MVNKKTILITLALLIAVIPSVSAATFFDRLVDEPSVIEDPLLCTAIDMWGCEIPPEDAIYGELYTHNMFTVPVPAIDIWENVTGINQTGNFSVLEQSSPDVFAIRITRNGTYLADYSVSMQAPGGASEYDFGISLNNEIPENKTHSHRVSTAGGNWGVLSLSAILELIEGDKLFLQVLDHDAPARDLEIQNANFNVHELQTFQTTQTVIINQTTGITGNITGVWVNKTGDTMSGDLNISAAVAITETLRVAGHSAFGTTGSIFAIRVLDVAENIAIDSSFNGVVSVLRQQVNNSGGREILAFNYEVVCDNNITCDGNMAGYRGNSRNRGWSNVMRGGYVTIFNERADHNITSAVGLFAVIATRLNNIRGMITTADAVRPHFVVENGTIGNATAFRLIDASDKTPSTQGDIWNMWGIKIDDLDSDKHDASWTFDLGDSINTSRIRGNYTGDQLLNQTFLMVPEWMKVPTTLYVYKNGTINVDANYSVSSGDVVIWSNGTVEIGAVSGIDFTDAFVNRTGDIMTGDLNITDGTEHHNITADGRINQRYYEASGQGIITFDTRRKYLSEYIFVNGDVYTVTENDIDIIYDTSGLEPLTFSILDLTWLDYDFNNKPTLSAAGILTHNFMKVYVNYTLPDGNFINYSTQIANRFVVSSKGDTEIGGTLDVAGTTNVTTGHFSVREQPRARAYLGSDQLNLVNGVWTKVLLDTESYDPENKFGSNKYQPGVSGYYQVNARVVFKSLVADKRYVCSVYKNGAAATISYVHASLNSLLACVISDIIYLDTNDFIELYAKSDSGGNLVDVGSGAATTMMSAQLLA